MKKRIQMEASTVDVRDPFPFNHAIFNDFIHGHMDFHPLLVVFIDTKHLQRLRNIKQLGTCYFVYPSASHNRFEHSLGTAYLAGVLFDSLLEKRRPPDVPDNETEKKRKLCVQIAALCHDIGHGPFSHTWEKFRHRVDPSNNWRHEEESIRLIDSLMEEKISPTRTFAGCSTVRDVFYHYKLTDSDLDMIKNMIAGQEYSKNYMYQIVSNKNNDIDVDKWDYLARDSAMLNIPISFDYKRLIHYCCILPNDEGEEQICFRKKEYNLLAEMFLTRGRLHDRAYQHKKVKIIEEMLVDAFVLANERLKLTTSDISDLTDHIYQKIRYDDFGMDENLARARDILIRIETRHLYKCIANIPFEDNKPDPADIMKRLNSVIDIRRHINEISLTFIELDMTKSNKERGLKNVMVYGKKRKCKPFNWDEVQNYLKIDLKNLKRKEILVLFKGRDVCPKGLGKNIEQLITEMVEGLDGN